MTDEKRQGGSSGEHAQTAAVDRLFYAIDESTKAWNISIAESAKWWKRILVVLICTAALIGGIGAYSAVQADRSQDRQDAFAAKLEAIAAQVSTVQATTDSTKDSVEVIEDRPTLDLEVVDAQPSASDGPAQPTALVVIRKPRQSANQQPSVLFAVPLPSVPSGAAPPEPKR